MDTKDKQTGNSDYTAADSELVLKTAYEAAFNTVTLAEAILTANRAGQTNLVEDIAEMILLKMVDVGNDLDCHIADLGLA